MQELSSALWMHPLPNALFLGLDFALCIGIEKPAAEKYPTSCILFPGDAPELTTLQRTVSLETKLAFQRCSEIGISRAAFPNFLAAAIQAWRTIS